MRITNFSSVGFISLSGSFCNRSTPAVFHNLTLTINNQSVAMELDSVTMTIDLSGSLGSGKLNIYIGGLPGTTITQTHPTTCPLLYIDLSRASLNIA